MLLHQRRTGAKDRVQFSLYAGVSVMIATVLSPQGFKSGMGISFCLMKPARLFSRL